MAHHLLTETERMDWSEFLFSHTDMKKITADICMSEKMYAHGPGKFSLFTNL